MKKLRSPVVFHLLLLGLVLLAVYLLAELLHLDPEDLPSLLGLTLVLGVALILVLWLRRHLEERALQRDLSRQAHNQAKRGGEDARRDQQNLQKVFDDAFTELSRAIPGGGLLRRGGPAALPWLIVIGPSGAGKTTALDHSGLRFTPLGKKLQGTGGTRDCTWWLAEEAIILDTSGRYAEGDQYRDEWLEFLALLRRRRRNRPIDAAVLQISIGKVLELSNPQRRELATELRQRLDELSRHLGVHFPVHLVFNKSDRLEGFSDFFEGLSDEERGQGLGFSLDLRSLRDRELASEFQRRYENMVLGLEARLTRRLIQVVATDPVQQREAKERALCFPTELRLRMATLSAFVESIFYATRHSDRPRLVAVHLTSAASDGDTLARRGVCSARAELLAAHGFSHLAPNRVVQPIPTENPFFLQELYRGLIEQARTAAQPNAARRRILAAQLAAASVAGVLICSLGGARSCATTARTGSGWRGSKSRCAS